MIPLMAAAAGLLALSMIPNSNSISHSYNDYNDYSSSSYSSYPNNDRITSQTLTNWFADEVDYLLQPGLQNSTIRSAIEQFKRQHAAKIAHNIQYDSHSSRDEVKEQVHNLTRSLVIDFIMKNVQQTVNRVLHKLGVNANWIHNNLVSDIIDSYNDTVLRLLDNNQRLTELYKDLERNIERIVRAQLGHR